jgi:uncharacterized Zn finger protein (UPF0148 family)
MLCLVEALKGYYLVFRDEIFDLLVDFGGEVLCPCHGTTATHQHNGSKKTTNPYIIDRHIFEPKEIQIQNHQNQQQNLQMLARESGSFECQLHRQHNQHEIDSIGYEVAHRSALHTEMRNEEIVEQDRQSG